MHIGICFANIGPFATPEGAGQLAEAVETNGIESIWTVEHVVVPAGYDSPYPYSPDGKMPGPEESPIPDPLSWLSFMAAKTSTVKLATGILILPQRNPVVLAKEVATLDVLSGGRTILGIGAGWLEEEFDAIGVPFEDRGKRTDEYIEALRELWTSPEPTFAGDYVSFERAKMFPQPPQGAVPIVVGGDSNPAARRAGRYGNGYIPGKMDGIESRIELMRSTAEDAGRDPDAIELSVMAGPDQATRTRCEDLGVHRLVLPSFLFWTADVSKSVAETLDQLA